MKLGRWPQFEDDINKRISSWRETTNLLESGFFKRLYLWVFVVPIAAKALEKLPKEVEISLPFNPSLPIVLDLPFSWVLLYVAALALVAARVIFVTTCPTFIRDYSDAGDATAKGITAQHIREAQIRYFRRRRSALSWREKHLLSKIYNRWGIATPEAQTGAQAENRVKSCQEIANQFTETALQISTDTPGFYVFPSDQTTKKIDRSQFIRLAFWDFERFLNVTHVLPRLVIAWLLRIGFAAATWTIVQGMVQVLRIYFT